MICKKCGENLPDNARECFTCGAKVKKDIPVAIVENGEGPSAPAPKNKLSAGKLFKYMYSSSSYFLMCLFVTLLGLAVVITMIESMVSGKWDTVLQNVIGVSANLLLIVPMWKMYVCQKTTVAANYIKTFRFFRIYTMVRMVSAVPELVISIVICLFAGFLIGELVISIVYCVMVAVFTVSPFYIAFKFSSSLERSAVNDRIQLDGIAGLRAIQLTFGIMLAVLSPFLVFILISSVLHFESVATIMTMLEVMLLMMTLFQVSEWLKGIIKKIEQE